MSGVDKNIRLVLSSTTTQKILQIFLRELLLVKLILQDPNNSYYGTVQVLSQCQKQGILKSMAKETLRHLANEHVREVEKEYALELLEEKHKAEHRAERCGCPQCRKYAQSLEDQVEAEANRLYYVPGQDHEEEWIINQLFHQRLLPSPEEVLTDRDEQCTLIL